MKKTLLIVRANMRKAKGQTVAIIVLILFAAMLLNLWLMLSMDYRANFDRYHDELNAEHVTFVVEDRANEKREFLTQTLSTDAKVKEFRLDECLYMVGTFPYNGGTMNGEFMFIDKQTATTRTVGKTEIVEDSDFKSGVYMPLLYQSDEIDVGKQ